MSLDRQPIKKGCLSVPRRIEGPVKRLVIACLDETRQKHLIDILEEAKELNAGYHVEITLTIGEIYKAAKKLGIKEF